MFILECCVTDDFKTMSPSLKFAYPDMIDTFTQNKAYSNLDLYKRKLSNPKKKN